MNGEGGGGECDGRPWHPAIPERVASPEVIRGWLPHWQSQSAEAHNNGCNGKAMPGRGFLPRGTRVRCVWRDRHLLHRC